MTPEEKRRKSVIRKLDGKERGGSGKHRANEELVQRLEFEREMRKEGYRKKPVGLSPGATG
jgi:hypothetical protein